MRRRAQAPGHGLACQQAGSQHHRWVGGIGATGDGGDHHRTVRQGGAPALHLHGGGRCILHLEGVLQRCAESAPGGFQGDPVLRTPRAGKTGLHGPHVQ